MYRERRSAAAPGSLVWSSRTSGSSRVLPDGCTDLMWIGDRLVVAGPDTTAYLTDLASGRTILGLRFAPGVGPAFLGVPADSLRDQRVPLADLWPAPDVARLEDALASAPDPARALARGLAPAGADPASASAPAAPDPARGPTPAGAAPASAPPATLPSPRSPATVLEQAVHTHLQAAPPLDPTLPAVVAALRAGHPVADVADEAGLSERQLHRRSLAAFGYGPKTLARILRAQHALTLANDGMAPAAVAHEAGYADQPHLSRDIRALTGLPLRQLIPDSSPTHPRRSRNSRADFSG